MNPELTDEQAEEFEATFSRYDTDGNGRITVWELGTVMRNMGLNPSEADLRKIIEVADKDGNGSVELPEFLSLMAMFLQENAQHEEHLRSAFHLLDKDNNGYIDAEELRYVMMHAGEQLSKEEAEEMLRDADVDGNGRIDYEEFLKTMLGE